jgi:transposase
MAKAVDRNWLVEQYQVHRKSLRALAREVGVSHETIRIWLHQAGVSTSDRRYNRTRIPKKQLEKLYYQQGLTIDQVAEKLGVSAATVVKRMEEFGLARRPPGTRVRREAKGPYGDPEWLRHHYLELNKSVKQLAQECQVSPTTIAKWTRRFNLWKRGPRKGRRP